MGGDDLETIELTVAELTWVRHALRKTEAAT